MLMALGGDCGSPRRVCLTSDYINVSLVSGGYIYGLCFLLRLCDLLSPSNNTSSRHKMAASVKISLPNGLNYDQPTGLFIDNKFVAGKGEKFAVYNPA